MLMSLNQHRLDIIPNYEFIVMFYILQLVWQSSRLSREVDECVRALAVGVTKTLLEDQGVQLALLVCSVVEIWLK